MHTRVLDRKGPVTRKIRHLMTATVSAGCTHLLIPVLCEAGQAQGFINSAAIGLGQVIDKGEEKPTPISIYPLPIKRQIQDE